MLLSAVSVLVVAQSSSEILDGLTNNRVYEADALMYVALSKIEKRVPYGELFGTTECLNIINEVLHELKRSL